MTDEELHDAIKTVATAIHMNFTSPNVIDSNFESANIVDAISQIAPALRWSAKHLGFGDAETKGWGAIESASKHQSDAIEAHGKEVYDGLSLIADSLNSVALAITKTIKD